MRNCVQSFFQSFLAEHGEDLSKSSHEYRSINPVTVSIRYDLPFNPRSVSGSL